MRTSDFKIGDRVVFPEGADAYPHFNFRERLEGTVASIDDDYLVSVRIDQHKDELNEWDNEIQVFIDDGEPSQIVEPIDTPAFTIHDSIKLAQAFSKEVREAFMPHELNEIRERNKVNSVNVCATHDFCDANMLMLDAYVKVVGREPRSASTADAKLWNEAWAIAKAAEFRI